MRSPLPLALFAPVFATLGCSNVSGSSNDGQPTCSTNPAGDDDAGDDDAADPGANACQSGDQDGLVGGCYAFTVTVDDTGFSPTILKAQNRATVALSVKNVGTKAHGFSVGCIPTGHLNGCPAQTCFPSGANVAPVPPGGSATSSFVTPAPEGIYIFRSEVDGDSDVAADGGVSGLLGQFILQ